MCETTGRQPCQIPFYYKGTAFLMLMGKDAFLRGETLGATQGPLSSFDAVMLAPTQARDLVI